MSRKVTAVVLCEDKQSRAVLYRYLKHKRGFERVRVLPLPAGEGCGSQYVRENYAREVRAHTSGSPNSIPSSSPSRSISSHCLRENARVSTRSRPRLRIATSRPSACRRRIGPRRSAPTTASPRIGSP